MSSFFANIPKYNRIQYLLAIALVLGGLLCIYTPNYWIFRAWARYSTQIALFYWLLGIVFMLVRFRKAAMVAFVACGCLCLYLRSVMNVSLQSPQETKNEATVRVALFRTSAILNDTNKYNYLLQSIRATDADIVSIQEITPDWEKIICDSLLGPYPYHCNIGGLNLYSSVLISKYRFKTCKTIYSPALDEQNDSIPSVLVSLESRPFKLPFYFISTYAAPPLFQSAAAVMDTQLSDIADKATHLKYPLVILGNLNIDATSEHIQQFKVLSNTEDSRRGFMPSRNDGHISLFDVPTDYIFYNSFLKCVDFQTINHQKAGRMGIMGSYQFQK